MVASRFIEREKGSLPVDVRRSETSLLKLPNFNRQKLVHSMYLSVLVPI